MYTRQQKLLLQIQKASFNAVLSRIKEAIVDLPEEEANSVAVAMVDDWAADAMLMHVRNTRFGLPVLAKLIGALLRFHYDVPIATRQPDGTWKPVWSCRVKKAAIARLRFWATQAARFETEIDVWSDCVR